MLFELTLDTVGYNEKPNKQQIVDISKRIASCAQKIHVHDFAKLILRGHTFCSGVFGVDILAKRHRRIEACFVRAQTIALDFDHGLPQSWRGISEPNIVYESFSGAPKHRAIWILHEHSAITSAAEYRAAMQSMFNRFGTADTACRDAARLFFGTAASRHLQILHENALNENVVQKLIKESPQQKKVEAVVCRDSDSQLFAENLAKLDFNTRRSVQLLRKSIALRIINIDIAHESPYKTLFSCACQLAFCEHMTTGRIIEDLLNACAASNFKFLTEWKYNPREVITGAILWAQSKA